MKSENPTHFKPLALAHASTLATRRMGHSLSPMPGGAEPVSSLPHFPDTGNASVVGREAKRGISLGSKGNESFFLNRAKCTFKVRFTRERMGELLD